MLKYVPSSPLLIFLESYKIMWIASDQTLNPGAFRRHFVFNE